MKESEIIPRRRGRKPKKPEKILERLREYYQQYTVKECAGLLGLTVGQVKHLLFKHYIKIKAEKPESKAACQPLSKPMSMPISKRREQMDRCIRQDYPANPTADIADKCGVNYYTVARRAIRIGTGKSKEYMRARWSTGGCHRLTNTEKEKMSQYLKKHFHDTPNIELANKFGVDIKTIRRYARKLGLQKSREFMQSARGRRKGRKSYTAEYEAWRMQRIAEVYPDGNEQQLQELSEELGLTKDTIRSIAYSIGVKRSEEKLSEIYRNNGKNRQKYDEAFITRLAEYYPTHTNDECAEHFGVAKGSIYQLARKYKIRKNREHIHRIRAMSRCSSEREKLIATAYADSSCDDLQRIAEKFGISRDNLRVIAHRLGVKRSKDAISRQKSIERSGPRRRKQYSDEYITEVRAYYACHTVFESAEHFGMNVGLFRDLLRRLGICKRKNSSMKPSSS